MDLVICDEACRTTGATRRLRLYMTGAPRVFVNFAKTLPLNSGTELASISLVS